MYGSSKPGKEVYKVENVLEYSGKFKLNNDIIGTYTNKEFVKLFSIYNFDKKYICPVKDIDLVKTSLEKIEGKKKNNLKKNKKVGFKNTSTMEDLNIIRKLVNILSVERANKASR